MSRVLIRTAAFAPRARRNLHWFVLLGVAIIGALAKPAHAQTNSPLYWNTGVTSGLWDSTSDWWTTPGGATNPGTVPGASNDAVFNGTLPLTVQLGSPQAALGLYFNDTGTTLLDDANTGTFVLSLGCDGINIASTAGAVTLGSSTAANAMPISIAASQTWINNSAAATGLTVLNGVSATSTSTLTFAGSGNSLFSGAITNGTGTLGLVMNGTGTVTLSGAGSSSTWVHTYSGGATVNAGRLKLDLTTPSTDAHLNLGTIAVNAGGTLELYDNSASTNYGNGVGLTSAGTVFTGSGTILKTGTGIVDWWSSSGTGTNIANFTGLIDVQAGALSVQTDQSGGGSWVKSAGAMSVEVDSGAIFDLRTDSAIVNNLTGSGTVASSFSSQTLTVGNQNGSSTFSGVIQNAGLPGGSASGPVISLKKTGTGTFTLNGSTVSTYSGATTVNSGALSLDFSNLASAVNLLSSSSALTLGGGTLSIDGKSTGATAQTLASLALTAGTGSGIVLNPNGGTSTTLTLTSATLTAGGGSALNFNYSAGTTNGSTVGNDVVAWNPTLTAGGIIGGGYSVNDTGGAGFATVASGKVIRLADPGSAGLPLSGGSATTNYFVNQSYSTSSTSTPGSLVEALSGGVAANTVTVDTTGLASGANLSLGANTLTLTSGGGILFGGANPYTITASGAGGITTSAAAGSTVFNNFDSSTVTISAPILANGASTVTFAGTGTTVLSGASTYTGATFIDGGTLRVGAIADSGTSNLGFGTSGALTLGGGTLLFTGVRGTTARTLSITGASTINVAAGGTLGFTGTGSGGGGLTVNGPGTLTLNVTSSSGGNPGNSLYVGSTATDIGSLTLNGGAVNLPQTYLLLGENGGGAAQLTINGGTLFHNAASSGTYLDNSTGANSILTVNGGAFVEGNNLNVGQTAGFTSTVNLNAGTISVVAFAELNNGATTTAVWNQIGGLMVTDGEFRVGLTAGGSGTVNLSGGTLAAPTTWIQDGMGSSGSMTISGTGSAIAYQFLMSNTTGNSVMNMNGGSLLVTNGTSVIGYNGSGNAVFNQTAGTAVFLPNVNFLGLPGTTTATGTATMNLSGGTLTDAGVLYLGATNTTGNAATLNVSGSALVSLKQLNLGFQAGVTSIVNLNGGTLRIFAETGGNLSTAALGTDTVNFNGGTLQIGAAITTPSGITNVIQTGGAVIDTQNYTYTITSPFTPGAGSTGGLTKYGAGTLTLNSSSGSTYTGSTTLNGGTLLLNFANTSGNLLPGTSDLNLNAGSTLSITGASSGTTSQNLGNLTLNSGGGSIILNPNGGSGITLVLGNTWTSNNNSTLLIDESAAGTSSVLSSNSSFNANGFIPWATVKTASSFGFAGLSGFSIGPYAPTGGTLPGAGASSTTDYILSGASASQTVTASETASSLTIAATAATQSLTISAGQTLSFTSGAVAFDGSAAGSAYSITGPGQFGASNTALTLSTYGPNALTISAPISSGTGSLILGGAGKTIVSGTNSYSGGTQLNSGTLSLGSTTALGSGTLTINGGTLDSSVANLVNANNNAQTWNGNFTFAGSNSLNLGTGAVTLGANVQINTSVNNTTNPLNVGGNISGGFGLSKVGAGVLVLTGSNTYTGGTTLSQGYLQLSSTSGFAIPGNFTGNNVLSPKVYTTVNNQFAPGSVMTFVGTGGDHVRFELLGTTQTLAGIDNSAGSGFGVIQNQEQAPIANSGNATLILNGSGNYFYNGYLRSGFTAGTLGLIYNGTGTQILSGGNITYTGPTTVNSGTLELYGTGGFNSPTTVNAGATLQLYGANGTNTNAPLTLNGGTLNDIAYGFQTDEGIVTLTASSTLNVNNSGAGTIQFYFDKGLAGAGQSLTMNNYGSTATGEVFRNSNGTLFFGSVIVNGGEISVGSSANAVLAGAALTLNNATLGLGTANGVSITATGATLGSLNGNGTVSGAGSTATLTVGAGNGTGSFGGTLINGGGTLSLTKIGAGTQTLNGNVASSYTGATTVNGGTLLLDMSNMATPTNLLAATSPLTLGGGTLTVSGGLTTSSQTLANLALTAGTVSNIVLNPNGGASTTLTITSVTLTTGAGATVNFNYSAGTTNGATVGNAIIAWNPTLTSGIIGAGYTVTDAGGSGFATVVSGNVVRLADSGSAGLPLSGGVSTTNYFVNQNYSTSSTSTPGSLVEALTSGVVANTVTVDTTGLASGANLALGANTLTLTSGGGISFSGANPYTITASSGGGLATGSAAGATTFNNYNSSTVTIGAPILDNAASTVNFAGPGTTILTAASTYTGATSIAGGALQLGNGASGNDGTISTSSAVADNGTLIYDVVGSPTNSFIISGAGTVTINGSGTVTLAGANTYTGVTTVNSGTLQAGVVSVANTSGAFGNNSAVILANNAGATLNITGFNTQIGSLSGGGTTGGNVTLGAATLTDVQSIATAFGGVISGTGALTMSGSGTLTLTGANNYSVTNLAAGTLVLSGGDNRLLSTSSLNFAGSATLNIGSNSQTLSALTMGVGNFTDAITGSGGTLNVTGTSNNLIIGNGTGSAQTSSLSLTGVSATFAAASTIFVADQTGSNQVITTATLTLGAGTILNAGNITLAFTNYTGGGFSPGAIGTLTINNGATLNVNALTMQNVNHNNNTQTAILNLNTGGTLFLGTLSTAAAQNQTTNTINFNGGTIENFNSSTNLTINALNGTNSFVLGASGTPTFDITSGRTGTVNQIMSGSGSLTKIDTGNLILAAANTYTGVTTLGAGNVTVSAAETAGTSGPLGKSAAVNPGNIIFAGGTLQYSAANQFDYSGRFSTAANQPISIDTNSQNVTFAMPLTSSSGTLTKLGSGTLTLIAPETYTGLTTITAGTLQFGDGTAGHDSSLTAVGGITDNATLAFDIFGTQAYAGAIGGNGAVTKLGAGTQTLSGANGYSGATTVKAGTLLLDYSVSPAVLNSVSTLTLGGGTLSLNGNSSGVTSQSLGNLTLSATTASGITLNPNGGASTNLTLGNTWTIGTGAGLLIDESAAGTSTLTSSPTLTGNIINTGILVKDATGTGLATVVGGQVVRLTNTTFLSPTNSTASTTTIDFTTTPTDPGYSSGTLTLTNAATHATDSLQIATGSGGTLDLGAQSMTFAGGGLLMSGSGNYMIQHGQLGTTGAALTVNQTGAGTLTISGTVSGGAGSLVKFGSGALTLTGTNAYTGVTTISAGTLQIGDGTTDGSIATSSGITDNGALIYNLVGTQNANAISGSGTLTKSGPGTLILTANSTYTGATTVSGGTLQAGTGGGTGTLTTSQINIAAPATFMMFNNFQNASLPWSVLQGSGTVYYKGTNSPTNGLASYSAGAIIPAAFTGTIVLDGARMNPNGGPTDLGGTTSIIVKPNGQLFIGAAGTYTTPLTLAGNGWTESGNSTTDGAIRLQANAVLAGNITLSANARISPAGSSSDTITGNISGGFQLEIGNTGTVAGAGTLTLTPTTGNVFSGLEVSGIGNVSTVVAGNANAFPTATPAALLMNGGTLNLNGFSFPFANLSGAAGIIQNNSATTAVTLTVGSDNSTTTYGGTLVNGAAAALALTKTGGGILTLTGANTYTGATTVSGGGLTVSGSSSIATSTGLSVSSGAQFNYLPTTIGTMTLATGSTLSLAPGSTVGVAFGDEVAVVGAATSSSTTSNPVYLNLSGAFTSGTTYTVLGAASGLTGGAYSVNNPTNFTYTVTQNGTNVQVTPTTVTALGAEYWLGNLTGGSLGVWAASDGIANSNWASDSSGTATPLVPGSTANVVFSATGAANQGNMTLGSNMAINSLTVNGTAASPNETNNLVLANTGGYTLTIGNSTLVATPGITVNAGSGSVTLNSNVALGIAQSWTNNSTTALTVNGAVSGAFALTAAGSGTIRLSGNNTYTGGTNINGGVLNAGSSSALGPSGSISFGGGTLQYSASNAVDYSSRFSTAASQAISIDTNGQNVTFAAALTSSGGTLVLNDTNATPGMLTLTAGGGATWANTYSGGTIVNSGTLKLNLTSQSVTAALNLGTINVASNATLQLFTSVSNNTALLSTGSTFTGSGTISVVAGTGDVDFWGAGPTATVVKNFSGLIDVKTGTLSDQTDGGGATAWSTSTTGMTLEVDGGAFFDLRTDSPVVGSLTGSGTIGSTYNSNTLTVGANNATGATFSGVIQNLLTGSPGYTARGQIISLTKIGTGTQILTGPSTYSGATVVDGGTLQVSTGGSISSASAITAGGGAAAGALTIAGGSLATTVSTTFAFNIGNGSNGTLNISSGSLTMSGAASGIVLGNNGTAAWTQTGGAVTLSGNGGFFTGNEPGGTTTMSITGGTLTASSSAFHLGERANTSLSLSGPAVVTLGALDYGQNAASTDIINLGDGATFSGGTSINNGGTSGVLALASLAKINGTLTFNFNGGTLKATGGSPSFFPLGTAAVTINAAGGIIDNGGFAIAIGQALAHGTGSPDGGLVLKGAGVTTLGGASAFNGGVTVTGGTLRVANTSGSATGSGAVNVGTSGSGATLAGSLAAGQGFIGGLVTIGNVGTLAASNAANAPTVTNAMLMLSGGLTLNTGSVSSFTLNNSSPNGTSNPLVNVSGGTFNVAGASTINVAFSSTLSNSLQTYDLFGYSSASGIGAANATGTTIGNLTLNTAGLPNGFTYQLVNNSAANQVDLTVSLVTLTWGGQNSSAWDTTSTNWFSGGAGSGTTFAASSAVSFGDTQYSGGPAVTSNHITVTSGGVSPSAVTFGNTGNPSNVGPTHVLYTVTSPGSVGIGGSTGVAINGGGTVDFTGINANTYTGATTISSGSTLVISADAQLGSGSGAGNIVLAGGGTLRAAGSFALAANRGITLGTTSFDNGAIDVTSGNTLSYAGAIVDSGGVDALATTASGGTLILTGNSTYTGATNVNGGTLQLGDGFSGNGSLASSSVVLASGATLAFFPTSSESFSSVVSGQGSLLLGAFATLTLAPSSPNTYTGGTTVAKGTLQLGNANAWSNNGSSGTALTIGGSGTSGTFDLNGNNAVLSSLAAIGVNPAQQAGQVITNSGGAGSMTPGMLTFAGGASPSVFGGSIQESSFAQVSLQVTGGTLTLSGPNSFSGGTTISGGTLNANGSANGGSSSTGLGNVTVNSGGTLAGAGQVLPLGNPNSSAVTISGGTIAGASGQTLTINGPLNLNSGSTATFTLTAPNSSSTGLIAVTGTLSVSGTPAVTLAGTSTLISGDTYDVLSYPTNAGISTSSFNLPNTFGSFNLNWTTPGNDELLLTVSTGSSGNTPMNAVNYWSASPPGSNLSFGTANNWSVQSGSGYVNIQSTIQPGIAQASGSPGTGGPFLLTDQGTSASPNQGNPLYASILAGTNSGSFTGGGGAGVIMSWRARAKQETDPQDGGTPSSPPLQYVGSYLISNVLNLNGLGTSGAANQSASYSSATNTPYFGASSVTEHETDPFVLQMNYNVPLLSNEAAQAKKGTIYLGWLAPAGLSSNGNLNLAAPTWEKAFTGDFNLTTGAQDGSKGTDAVANFQGSFLSYLNSISDSAHGFNGGFTQGSIASLTNAQLDQILGAYGVDPSSGNHDVWAVINHNSQFAVVPEPSTLLLAALGLAGLAGYRRRWK